MPSKKQNTVWKAALHTIAKIAILEAYLKAWFMILGRKRRSQDLLYVDGFAGPGEYTNYPKGSPIAALVGCNTNPATNSHIGDNVLFVRRSKPCVDESLSP